MIAVDLIRNVVVPVTLVVAQNYPIHQMIIILSINFLSFVFILICSPYKDKKTYFVNLFNETVLLFVCAMVLSLAILDNQEDPFEEFHDNHFRIQIGWAIFYFDLTLKMVLFLIFLLQSLVSFFQSINNFLLSILEEGERLH